MLTDRWITLWRKTGEECLDWDFHVSFDEDAARTTVENLKKRGVKQYATQKLGEAIPELSSEY